MIRSRSVSPKKKPAPARALAADRAFATRIKTVRATPEKLLNRKSLFAIAESSNGIDGGRFWGEPVDLPELKPETNVYDMRIVFHEDGCIYGQFCAEAKDPNAQPGDHSSAVAQAGLVRTKDFKTWERLPNLQTPASQQRNVVLHPEFVDGQYAFYTRPMDGFLDGGEGFGDVSNVTFANGWVQLPDQAKTVLIYYAGSDTRCYVARSSVDKLVDWCLHTPEEAHTTRQSVDQRLALIRANVRLAPSKKA